MKILTRLLFNKSTYISPSCGPESKQQTIPVTTGTPKYHLNLMLIQANGAVGVISGTAPQSN